MHYYQFNIGDYAKHTRHLTNDEDLAYRRMIDYCYLNETPLVDDLKKIARLINMRNCEEEVKNVLEDFFVLRDGAWHNSRVEKDLVFYAEKAEIARQNGKKGGRPPKGEKEGQPKTEGKKTSRYKFNDDQMNFATAVYNQVLSVMPATKKPNLDMWANSARLIDEIDEIKLNDAWEVFMWANKDPFWQSHILSVKKLREKFQTLQSRMGGKQSGQVDIMQQSANSDWHKGDLGL